MRDKGLPVGDIEHIRWIVKYFKEHRDNISVGSFFMMVLEPFYDCMWDGLNTVAGHVIYRLSDFVSEEERIKISIYPSENGSLIIDEGFGLGRWYSLEQWRKEWERYHQYIPELKKLLPPGSDILLTNKNQKRYTIKR
jgi:hypothetical protein